ncbi:SapC family protein [Mesorhizobium sp. M0621]|uniref:SapC family protein n=1 Tax=Mesorhizobium sp. M0621 TaxID=2956974 RepID=UPI00333BC0F8
MTLEGGEVRNLTDFQAIDEPAFNKLSDEAFLDLRKSGTLGMLYCHLASTNSWTSLVHQASLRKADGTKSAWRGYDRLAQKACADWRDLHEIQAQAG